MNTNEHRVREFAHQIWESEGRPHGQEQRHWEMACRLAEEAEQTQQPQQQAAPQHTTVEQNDTDILNKPKKAKAKALKKSLDETKEKPAAKSKTPKTEQGKKAKLLKDVVETELSPVDTNIQPV